MLHVTGCIPVFPDTFWLQSDNDLWFFFRTVVIFQPTRLHTKMDVTKLIYEDSDDSLSAMKKWLNTNV